MFIYKLAEELLAHEPKSSVQLSIFVQILNILANLLNYLVIVDIFCWLFHG